MENKVSCELSKFPGSEWSDSSALLNSGKHTSVLWLTSDPELQCLKRRFLRNSLVSKCPVSQMVLAKLKVEMVEYIQIFVSLSCKKI